MRLSASNLVSFIDKLPKDHQYPYINSSTETLVVVEGVTRPEGPVRIRRFRPSKGETYASAKTQTMSMEMLWRVANGIRENVPFNLDRILGASYNTRSSLEALLAHTSQFYYCYPGRVELIRERETIKRGHKHLIWCPTDPHEEGVITEREVDIVISEVPTTEIVYESVGFSEAPSPGLDIEMVRRHAQIQVALFLIGGQLGYRTWIAQNDKGLLYQNKRICEYPGAISDLRGERLLQAFDEGIQAALLIDCIWFKNGRLMPAVMEVEHSTGVRSGLLRMQKFKDLIPPFPSRWVIVAPDSDRDFVLRECQAPQFKDLDPKFFSYSAVEELYALCSKRKIKGITEEFLDCFMEPALKSA
ncbi:MAG: restriction endonuclease [Verrucomicrobia bacterium]|nr:restriction endonuclease [Verrucomicrobiota bacterium]MCH8528043.1 restriction endonuclease [Kiritimatiellia bacterium]